MTSNYASISLATSADETKGSNNILLRLLAMALLEAFCRYGIRSILALYLLKYLLLTKEASSEIYGGFTLLNYLTISLGAFLTDGRWGALRSLRASTFLILAAVTLLVVGTLLPPTSIGPTIAVASLGVLSAGIGIFKPASYVLFGAISRHQGKHFGVFTWLYVFIQCGAFLAPIAVGTIADTGNPADFILGFLIVVASALMLALITASLRYADWSAFPEVATENPTRALWLPITFAIALSSGALLVVGSSFILLHSAKLLIAIFVIICGSLLYKAQEKKRVSYSILFLGIGFVLFALTSYFPTALVLTLEKSNSIIINSATIVVTVLIILVV